MRSPRSFSGFPFRVNTEEKRRMEDQLKGGKEDQRTTILQAASAVLTTYMPGAVTDTFPKPEQ